MYICIYIYTVYLNPAVELDQLHLVCCGQAGSSLKACFASQSLSPVFSRCVSRMRMCENPCQYVEVFWSVHPSLSGGCRTCQYDLLTLKAWTLLMDGPGPGCRDIVPATFSSTGCCNMRVLSPMVQYGVAKSLRKSLKYAWEVTPWWLALTRLPGERPVVAYNHDAGYEPDPQAHL